VALRLSRTVFKQPGCLLYFARFLANGTTRNPQRRYQHLQSTDLHTCRTAGFGLLRTEKREGRRHGYTGEQRPFVDHSALDVETMGCVKECYTDRLHCSEGLHCRESSRGMFQARRRISTISTSNKLLKGHSERRSAGGMSCLEGTQAMPYIRSHHPVPDLTTCCDCECSFCQDVTCVWLPLQLCCGDDVHLSSFLQYVSTACSDRQQQNINAHFGYVHHMNNTTTIESRYFYRRYGGQISSI
jgi:hypothetical protein